MSRKPKTIEEMKYFDFSFEPGKEYNSRLSVNSGIPLVSVVTIIDNVEKPEYIEQMARSLKNQTFPYWEWILVAKKKYSYLSDIFESDKRIRVITKEFETIARAKLIAVNNATTNLIFNFDRNNLIDKTMLECGYFTMYFNKEATFAYSKQVEFEKNELLLNNRLKISEEKKKNIISSGAFIRRDKLLEVEGYEDLPDDMPKKWYVWLDFLSKGYIPLKMGFYGYWHRNLKSSNQKKASKEIIHSVLRDKIEKIDSKTEIIQFDDSYEVDYKTPEKVDLKRKPIVPEDGKKRILFILPWTAVGGAEIFDFNLIKGLRQKNYEISVITTQKCDYALRQGIEQYVDEYFDLTSFLKRRDWASFIEYIIRSRRINLVFLTNSYYGYYVLPWLKCHFKDIPFVDYIHSENWTLRNGGKPKDSNAVADYLDATYTCTEYLKNLMYKTMKRNVKNVKPVYIGTDTSFFDPSIELPQEKELKEMYEGKKLILLPCRVVYGKRPLFAVKVIKRMAEVRDDVRLAIVGDGPALEATKEYIIENDLQNIVTCFGYQSDVRPFYKVATATIIPSLQEGLALIAYESLSMGVPVVSADIGGQKELVGPDVGAIIDVYQKLEEQMDFNYSEEELQKYTDALLDVIDRVDNTNIREVCREKVVKGFSISNMIETFDKEFTKLIKNGSKVDKKLLDNIGLAERYLLVHSVLESKDEKNINIK